MSIKAIYMLFALFFGTLWIIGNITNYQTEKLKAKKEVALKATENKICDITENGIEDLMDALD